MLCCRLATSNNTDRFCKFLAGRAGCVLACAEEDGGLLAIVESMSLVRRVSEHSDAWRKMGSVAVWPAQCLQSAVAWYADDVDWVVLRIS